MKLAFFLALAVALDAAAANETEKSALWRQAERTIGVRVILPSTSDLPDMNMSGVEFMPLSASETGAVTSSLRLFIEEFSKYPRSLLRGVNLEWVAFVKGLKVAGGPRTATYARYFAPVDMAPRGGVIFDVRKGAAQEDMSGG